MTLANQYSISVRHQRSTRIDSDLTTDFFTGLIYHGTAQTALDTLLRQFGQAGQKAYTLTGAYGSGKSTIALLLTGLLNENKEIQKAANNIITPESRSLLASSVTYKKGWLQIRAVGGVNSPVNTFWSATIKALNEHSKTKLLVEEYQNLSPKNEADLISLWESLFIKVKPLVDGVLLLSDEMGKTLEFINKNKGELHLFQDVAEILSRIDTPVIFLGLLHQSFGEYAKDRGTKLQEEWGKIQGRYTNIQYNVSTDETVALLAQSIVPKNTNIIDNTPFVNMTLEALNANDDNKNRTKKLLQRLKAVAPIHPLVALLLGPISKRRFSQNERSTFSFLNSHEQHSFQLFLKNNTEHNARYSLHDLWDYLEANLESAILSSPDAHGWAEASETINRIDVPEATLNILKSIALLTLFGKPAKLYPTELTLQAATGITKLAELKKHLKLLTNASSIIYRKHQSSWVIFEGSDLDISSLLENKLKQLTGSNESIEHISYSMQTIAKGHYHTIGNLRWIEQSLISRIEFVDSDKITNNRKGEFSNFILLIEPAKQEKITELTTKNPTISLANAINSEDIKTHANEVYALELLKAENDIGNALQHDKVAQKEYDSRLSDAKKMLWSSIEEAFTYSFWTVRGQVYNKHYPLSELATELADYVYNKSPRILNELVNRNKLSGTAVSAQKKLLKAMLEHSSEVNLGITGFPPEMSMYISCLKSTKMHQTNGDESIWSISNTPKQLKEMFLETNTYLKENTDIKIDLNKILTRWNDAPFGVSYGVFPILVFAYLKTLGQDIAFYEKTMSGDFEFISEPDLEYVYKIQKSPKELAIKFIKLENKDKEWLDNLSMFASSLTNSPIKTNLLAVATPLVTTMQGLTFWVKNANELVKKDAILNKKVLRIRDLFLQANDPHDLLIKDLVNILDPENNLTYIQRINELDVCINILKAAHEKMLEKMNIKIKQFFPETGEELLIMCQQVEEKSGDLRLKSFARELGKSQEFGLKWLESLIAVTIGRGIQNWNESNILSAEQKLSDYSQDFLRIVKANQHSKLKIHTPKLQTKTISLILEEDKGLINYTKEIKIGNSARINPIQISIKEQLSQLSEFDKIDVLHQLLKEALEAQG